MKHNALDLLTNLITFKNNLKLKKIELINI